VQAETGGGGAHFFFAAEGAIPSSNSLLAGLDVKGNKGLVVAPPSLHLSGKRYRWAEGRAPGNVELAPAPRWLLELAQSARASAKRVAYERGAIAELPAHALQILRYDGRVRARFQRETAGLRDTSPSGVDFSLAIALARWNLPGEVIEAVVSQSRARAGLPDRPRSYWEATVGKAIGAARGAP
jgi:hypothetical protein